MTVMVRRRSVRLSLFTLLGGRFSVPSHDRRWLLSVPGLNLVV